MYTTGESPSNFPNLLVLQVATQLQVLKEQRKAWWGCPWAVLLSTDVNGFVWKLKNTLKWPFQWTWCSQPSKSYFHIFSGKPSVASVVQVAEDFIETQQTATAATTQNVAPPWKFQPSPAFFSWFSHTFFSWISADISQSLLTSLLYSCYYLVWTISTCSEICVYMYIQYRYYLTYLSYLSYHIYHIIISIHLSIYTSN
jgi:hypothetical protein